MVGGGGGAVMESSVEEVTGEAVVEFCPLGVPWLLVLKSEQL